MRPITLAILLALIMAGAPLAQRSAPAGEWRHYAGDYAGDGQHQGRPYIVLASGSAFEAELIAFALPQGAS